MHWNERSTRNQLLVGATLIASVACQEANAPGATPDARSSASIEAAPAAQGTRIKARIKSVSLSGTTLTVGGPAVLYDIAFQNTGPALSDVFVQGEIAQGTTLRGAGGTNLQCGAGNAVLPKGTCVMTNLPATASNALGGQGWLAAGAASLRLTLYQGTTSPPAVLDISDTPVTLNGVLITTITDLTGQTFTIGGDGVQYDITFNNSMGAAQSVITVQAELIQFGNPDATRGAGGFGANCGAGQDVAPIGSCTMSALTAIASNTASGTGTLVPGAAILRIDILQDVGAQHFIRDRREFIVNLQ